MSLVPSVESIESTKSTDIKDEKRQVIPFLGLETSQTSFETPVFKTLRLRIQKLCYGLDETFVDSELITQKVCSGLYHGITDSELWDLAAETAAHLTSHHPDYGLLAGRLAVSHLHENTETLFSATIQKLQDQPTPLIASHVCNFVTKHKQVLDHAILHQRDYDFDYFGFKTLEKSYLLRLDGKVVERPQFLWMRVACGIHCPSSGQSSGQSSGPSPTPDSPAHYPEPRAPDAKEEERCLTFVLETYSLMSAGFFIHASPTLFHAGTPHGQLSSCFLVKMKGENVDGIYSTLRDCALISHHLGGIGLDLHDIPATGTTTGRTQKGYSHGLVPLLRVFNDTARYVDQGGGKRRTGICAYIETWHADVFDFLELRKNNGAEHARARDLFLGLWISDLFMKRVEENKTWTLFCPQEAPGLAEVWGTEFEQLYTLYENKGKGRRSIPAQVLWKAILVSQEETGTPYMLYKDSCNRKSNQQHLGTIRSSNLCTEIIEYTAVDEIAVCNLASLALPRFVKMETAEFDHQKLFEVTQVVTRNLNRIIDINHYPVPEAQKSNQRHRPIGIGVTGLADTFVLLRYPFESPDAQRLNKEIFETIYFASLTASKDLARESKSHDSFAGSPMSRGIFQFDMWGVTPDSKRWDWDGLRKDILTYGCRLSLHVAPMPTATTSQIIGHNECFEPFTSNLYVRRTLAGEFVCASKHLIRDLIKLGLWNSSLKNRLVAHKGSVQNLSEIPIPIRELYKTVWEMKHKVLIDMAVDRGAFIDQSQSLSAYMTDVTYAKLSSLHFYAWKKGLKTGMYYLRTRAAADAIPFTVDQQMLRKDEEQLKEQEKQEKMLCLKEQDDGCLSCSS